MFCTCSRICSMATFISTEMLVSSSAEDLLPRGVGLTVQFLDQEIEPFAHFTAGLQQAGDFIQVGAPGATVSSATSMRMA